MSFSATSVYILSAILIIASATLHLVKKEFVMEIVLALEFLLLFMVAGFFILWVWALVDIIISKFQEDLMQVIWLLIVFFLPFVGVLLYLLIGRSMKRTKETQDYNLSRKYDHLAKIKKLLDEGVISEAEFASEKEKILNH